MSPFVPTPHQVVREALRLANVAPEDTVYDLGSGDGRVVLTAARDFNARAVGVEIRRRLVEESIRRIKREKLDEQVSIVHGDFFSQDLSGATVVTLYQLRSINEALRPILEKQLRPDARVVAIDFPVPGWRPVAVGKVKAENKRCYIIYLYVPAVSAARAVSTSLAGPAVSKAVGTRIP